MSKLSLGGLVLALASVLSVGPFDCVGSVSAADPLRDLQTAAAKGGKAEWGHWGTDAGKYSTWFSHSNRLIPVYTFGIKLDSVRGEHSAYRDAEKIKALYGYEPEGTLNPQADYFDQTQIVQLEKQAVKAGKRRIIVFVFDGMDWQTTRNAAIYAAGKVGYDEGRGAGLNFQDYRGAETDYGYYVTSPHNEGTKVNVDTQTVENPGGSMRGGYAFETAGVTPWAIATDLGYPISQGQELKQAYTDSASSATSIFSGIKTYNDSINVDAVGRQVEPYSRELQREGWAIGVVSSVPISHATPACAYANNVHRDDYQDITRDQIGVKSISHPKKPLPGVDVLIGGGWGEEKPADKAQGANYVAGNTYIAAADLDAIDAAKSESGKYVVVQRASGVSGKEALERGAKKAIEKKQRLFGYFGAKYGHFPYRTADGKYDPTLSSAAPPEVYSEADINENPKLADCAVAALEVLSQNKTGFWLMVEAGDVDWANHANNLDNSIGAVISGDLAFKAVCEWVEKNGGWKDTALILTADHGHYFFLEKPEALVAQPDDTKGVAQQKPSVRTN